MTAPELFAAAEEYAGRCERIAADIGVRLDGTAEAKAEWLKLALILRQLRTMADLQTVPCATIETGIIRVGVY